MAQMFAYTNMPARSLWSFAGCSVAAVGDALYVVAIYWAGRLLVRDTHWVAHLTAGRMIIILICGLGFGCSLNTSGCYMDSGSIETTYQRCLSA
jgi:hypothetical protein